LAEQAYLEDLNENHLWAYYQQSVARSSISPAEGFDGNNKEMLLKLQLKFIFQKLW